MTIPTPASTPDVNNTVPAEDENPAEGGNDTHFTEEQAGLDPDNVSPTQDATKDEEADKLFNTDKGVNG